MSDDLRERIAAALESADRVGYGTRPYAELADAVIRELPELQAKCGSKNWAEKPIPTHCQCGEPVVDWGACAKHLEEGLADDE